MESGMQEIFTNLVGPSDVDKGKAPTQSYIVLYNLMLRFCGRLIVTPVM